MSLDERIRKLTERGERVAAANPDLTLQVAINIQLAKVIRGMSNENLAALLFKVQEEIGRRGNMKGGIA